MFSAENRAASASAPSCSSPTSISSSSSSSAYSSSSSSSSSSSEWRYDVFLSFRGLDTRDNFSDHLYSALKERGVKVFRDDKHLGKGKIITQAIFRAIEESKLSIVVFSRNYASSEWCLDEIVKIVECMKENSHVAFPVFYHVSPDDVMNQTGHYEEAFLRHQKLFKKERLQRWRIALIEIAGISGWDVQNYSDHLQAKSGMKVLINKSLIDISVNEHILPLQDLSDKCFTQKNLEEPRSHKKFLDMVGIYRMEGVDGESSQSNLKTENESMKGRLNNDKSWSQNQNLVGNAVSGKDTSSLHILAREPVKVREYPACVAPLELKSSGISEASCAVVGKYNAAKLQSKLSFQEVINRHQLQFFMPESSNGKKIVRIPRAVVEEGIKQWDACLVGQLLGKSADISVMLSMANGLWGEEGRIEVTKTENDLYIFKFPNERTRDFVLESGPWYVANNPLVMRRWQPRMKLLELNKSRIPVWIKLTGIPMEYMTMQGLSYIASALGKPLNVDRATASVSAIAKVCVEVSIEDKMMENITVMDDDGEELVVRVEYLWMPEKCISCREFGHSIRTCLRFKNLIGKSD